MDQFELTMIYSSSALKSIANREMVSFIRRVESSSVIYPLEVLIELSFTPLPSSIGDGRTRLQIAVEGGGPSLNGLKGKHTRTSPRHDDMREILKLLTASKIKHGWSTGACTDWSIDHEPIMLLLRQSFSVPLLQGSLAETTS